MIIKTIRYISFVFFTFCSTFAYAQNQLSEEYLLAESAQTSAGVYSADGTLLRTLWSNVEQSAGTHSPPTWNGLDDYGVNVSSEAAYIKVIANNINVEWNGVIGNLSDSFTKNVHKELHFYRDMLIHDNVAYFASGWTEGAGSVITSSLDSMGVAQEIMPKRIQQMTERIATDGTRLYMAGRLGGTPNISYIQAAKFDNLDNFDAFENFQGETVNTGPKWGNNSFKATDIVDSYETFPNPDDIYALELSAPHVTGLSVQKMGNYLFIARERLNSLHILHKVTGELMHSLTYAAPKHTKVDGQDNLWMVYDDDNGNEIIERFTVNESTGLITSSGLSIKGVKNAQAMTFNPDNTVLAVADAAANAHQVKGYSTSSGVQQWTLGKDESYKDVAKVYDDKFMFAFNTDNDPYISVVNEYARGYIDEYSFLAYEDDGSLWVNDRGNFRYQKYNPITSEYLGQMMWQRGKYGVSVDPSDPTRVFYDYLEFEVDYDKPIQPNNENGAWRLINNWAGGIPLGQQSWLQALKDVTTLKNGLTYALITSGSSGTYEIVELVDGGTIRQTGVIVGYQYGFLSLKSDGTLRQAQGIAGVQYLYEQSIIGFDASNNPILGPETIWDSYDETGNYVKQDGARRVSGEFTSNGNMVIFDGSHRTQSGSGFHLSAWNKELGTFAFKTAREVDLEFRKDPYPDDGSYDMRDEGRIQYRGSVALAMDDWIIWGYNGEFWEQRQSNKWHMVSEDGLFLRDFGVATDSRFQLPHFAAGMAGNAFNPKIVKAGSNNDVYLWHNDESYHAGAHRWQITNLDSIQKFDLKICTDSTGNNNGNCNNPVYTIGGTITGLASDNSVVLTSNGGDKLTVKSNGEFRFMSPLQSSVNFEIELNNHIDNQDCVISNSIGIVSDSNITNININCTPVESSYTIGGHIYGLSPGQPITLRNNSGEELITDVNGVFTFSTPLATRTAYDVTIESQPKDKECTFSDVLFAVPPSGIVRERSVNGIGVTCHKIFGDIKIPPLTQQVISFTLINADTGNDLATYPVNNGLSQATILINDTPNISLRINTVETESVMISGLDSGARTENQQPFSLLGDNNGVYQAWTPFPGVYEISATPIANQTSGQTAVFRLNVSLTIYNSNIDLEWIPAINYLLLEEQN